MNRSVNGTDIFYKPFPQKLIHFSNNFEYSWHAHSIWKRQFLERHTFGKIPIPVKSSLDKFFPFSKTHFPLKYILYCFLLRIVPPSSLVWLDRKNINFLHMSKNLTACWFPHTYVVKEFRSIIVYHKGLLFRSFRKSCAEKQRLFRFLLYIKWYSVVEW